jgi:hypothetical protein
MRTIIHCVPVLLSPLSAIEAYKRTHLTVLEYVLTPLKIMANEGEEMRHNEQDFS